MTRQLFAVGIAAALVAFGFAAPGTVTANPARAGTEPIPRAFLPVVAQFARSPIPVFYPTWIPRIRFHSYATFCPSRHKFVGPAYELGLYTSPGICDHAHRLLEIFGVAGDTYAVNRHTRPVWLGKHGWAYVDPDRNSGWTISFVRAVGTGPSPREYTYGVLGGCSEGQPKSLIACLKHIAASMRRYVPSPRRT
jgi:hypothetical protein